jgi:peptide/nickel transport system substrate-binding protein
MFTRRASGAVAVALAAVALALPASIAKAQSDRVVIAWQVDPQTWDPNRRTNPGLQSLYKMIFDQPLTQGPDQKIQAAVVKAWNLSKDGKSVTLELRDDVYWHDGKKMTSADIRYTFLERGKAGHKIDLVRVWRNVVDVETPSPTKAVIKLKAPMPTAIPWLAFLANFVVPKHYIEKVGVEAFSTKPIGSGPYRLVEYQRNSRIVLEAFDKYWGPKPKIKKVTVLIIKDPSARVAAIQSGRVDFAPDVPVRESIRLGERAGLSSDILPISRVIMLQIRNDRAFLDKNVRLAAHHAINKAAISRALYGGRAVPLSVVATPGTPGHVKGFTFPYSPAKARALLAKSGFSAKKPVSVGLATFNGVFPGDYDIARAIASMWKKVGINATIQVIEQPKYFELNRGNKLPEATLYSWDNATGDPEMFTGYLMHPKLPFSAWKDMGIGGRVMKLFGIVDYKTRIAGYRKVNVDATNEGATIPLLQAVTTMAYKSKLNVVKYANGWVLPHTWSWK